MQRVRYEAIPCLCKNPCNFTPIKTTEVSFGAHLHSENDARFSTAKMTTVYLSQNPGVALHVSTVCLTRYWRVTLSCGRRLTRLVTPSRHHRSGADRPPPASTASARLNLHSTPWYNKKKSNPLLLWQHGYHHLTKSVGIKDSKYYLHTTKKYLSNDWKEKVFWPMILFSTRSAEQAKENLKNTVISVNLVSKNCK